MPTSGYRDKKDLGPVGDYPVARLGSGPLMMGLWLLVTDHLFFAAIAVLVGAPLLRYGVRNL